MRSYQLMASLLVASAFSSFCVADEPIVGHVFRAPKLDGGWCSGCALPQHFCPDDYCRKLFPRPPCCPNCFCRDDYCKKPAPHIPCLFRCCFPDDYCSKPCPRCPTNFGQSLKDECASRNTCIPPVCSPVSIEANVSCRPPLQASQVVKEPLDTNESRLSKE